MSITDFPDTSGKHKRDRSLLELGDDLLSGAALLRQGANSKLPKAVADMRRSFMKVISEGERSNMSRTPLQVWPSQRTSAFTTNRFLHVLLRKLSILFSTPAGGGFSRAPLFMA